MTQRLSPITRFSRTALLVPLLFLLSACASQQKAVQKPTLAAFWPPYPDQPRVQYLTSFNKSSDIAPPKTSFEQLIYGKESEEIQAINKPYGLAFWHDRIYVCDLRKDCVTILDLRKKQTLVMGHSGGDNLVNPTDIAIADDGTKYVADSMRGLISVYDAEDHFLTSFGHKDLKPVGVAIWQNDLYVCDFKAQDVEVYDRHSGKMLRTIGTPGTKPGEFIRPLGIATDKDGNVYVTDVLNCRLSKFDRNGKYIEGFGTVSAKAGGFVRPKQVAVDSQGVIYVVDAAFNNVQLFDQQGRLLTFFGSAGTHPGAMYLPAGITVTDQGLDLFAKYVHPDFQAERLIFVTNQFGTNKIAVYAFGHLKPGKTVADIANTKGFVPEGTAQLPARGAGLEPVATQPTTMTAGEAPAQSTIATTQPDDASAQPAAPEVPERK